MEIEFLEYASEDINKIIKYISRDSSFIAQKYIIKLIDYIYSLSLFPELGTLIQKQYNIWKLVYHSYIIIYQIDYHSNLIRVIRILHSKQDFNIILKHIKKYIS